MPTVFASAHTVTTINNRIKRYLTDTPLKAEQLGLFIVVADVPGKVPPYTLLLTKKAKALGIPTIIFPFNTQAPAKATADLMHLYNLKAFKFAYLGVLVDGLPEDVDMIMASLPQNADLDCQSARSLAELLTASADHQVPASKHINDLQLLTEADAQIVKTAPSTVIACLELLADYYQGDINRLADKNVTVYGRGTLLGKPLQLALNRYNANVTVIHSKTTPANVYRSVKGADIVVLATSQVNVLPAYCLDAGTLVIDAGAYDSAHQTYAPNLDLTPAVTDQPPVDFNYTTVPNGLGPVATSCVFYKMAVIGYANVTSV